MLNTSVSSLPSTSSVTIRKFKSLGINTYFDLLNYFPTRYEDYSIISKIDKIQVGEIVTISGKIIETGRLVPIYSEKKGLSTKTIREKMFFVLNSIVGDDPRVVPEFLPPKI